LVAVSSASTIRWINISLRIKTTISRPSINSVFSLAALDLSQFLWERYWGGGVRGEEKEGLGLYLCIGPPAHPNKGRLHLAEGVVDGGAPAFVEDLDAEDLGCRHGTVFVGTGDGDIEGRIWSEYQGSASSLLPPTSDRLRLSS
jgi:hypothetical protein